MQAAEFQNYYYEKINIPGIRGPGFTRLTSRGVRFGNFEGHHCIYIAEGKHQMSWQAFSWYEIATQSKRPSLAVRLQPVIHWTSAVSQEALVVAAAFLTPCALVEAALGFWRFGVDVGWTDNFFIANGLLSHWQVWFALAIITQAGSVTLNRRLKSLEQTAEENN